MNGDVAASFLRVNCGEPSISADTAALPPPQIAAGGKAFTAQVMCLGGWGEFGRPSDA